MSSMEPLRPNFRKPWLLFLQLKYDAFLCDPPTCTLNRKCETILSQPTIILIIIVIRRLHSTILFYFLRTSASLTASQPNRHGPSTHPIRFQNCHSLMNCQSPSLQVVGWAGGTRVSKACDEEVQLSFVEDTMKWAARRVFVQVVSTKYIVGQIARAFFFFFSCRELVSFELQQAKCLEFSVWTLNSGYSRGDHRQIPISPPVVSEKRQCSVKKKALQVSPNFVVLNSQD